MSDIIAFATTVEWIAFAIPAGVLLVLIALLVISISRRRARRAGMDDRSAGRQDLRGPDQTIRAFDASSDATSEDGQVIGDAMFLTEPLPPPGTDDTALAVSPPGQDIKDEPLSEEAATRRLAELDSQLSASSASSDVATNGSAVLQLERARCLARLNRRDDQKAALLAAIAIGQSAAQPAICATARLALADIARASGDLTSACEHWQMARVALKESGQQDEHDRVDQMMRENGCPTDWVLTDF